MLRGFRTDRAAATVYLETRLRCDSWGEHLAIELIDAAEGGNRYRITARPRNRVSLLDLGRGRQLVRQTIAAIDAAPKATA